MRWYEFAARQQALATVAHDQLIKPGVVLAWTTRRDGSARISGVEPLIMDGELWLSMMPASAKARDLVAHRGILVHSIVTSPCPPAEIMMRGTVRAETGDDMQRRYAAAVQAQLGWQPVPGEFALFAVDINDVTYIGHEIERVLRCLRHLVTELPGGVIGNPRSAARCARSWASRETMERVSFASPCSVRLQEFSKILLRVERSLSEPSTGCWVVFSARV